MSQQPQYTRSVSVLDAINEAQVLNFHGDTEDDLMPAKITREEVESELSIDLLDGLLRGAL